MGILPGYRITDVYLVKLSYLIITFRRIMYFFPFKDNKSMITLTYFRFFFWIFYCSFYFDREFVLEYYKYIFILFLVSRTEFFSECQKVYMQQTYSLIIFLTEFDFSEDLPVLCCLGSWLTPLYSTRVLLLKVASDTNWKVMLL